MSVHLNRLNIEKEALKRVLNFLPYPFLVTEVNEGRRRNIFVNEKFVDEIGYTCEEMPSVDDWFILAYPDEIYREEVKQEWNLRSTQAILDGSDSVFLQAKVQTKTKGARWYEVKSSVSGSINLVAFVDINENKAREEDLARTNRNKDKILSILGHDLRGPLRNLQALSSMLLKQNMTREEFLSMVKSVNEKAFQSLEFLDTTLIWTKSNFDKISITIEKLSPRALTESILPVYQNSFENKKIKISLEINSNVSIYSDAEILTIVIRNLISNAIKFTGENGSITISALQEGDFFIIMVKDTGVGMDQETIHKITDEHFSSKGTHQESGLGLGLKLCKELLQQIGSVLEIKSDKNKGTEMKIRLKNNLQDY
jgi:signal transduction histidine kinase